MWYESAILHGKGFLKNPLFKQPETQYEAITATVSVVHVLPNKTFVVGYILLQHRASLISMKNSKTSALNYSTNKTYLRF